METVWTRKQRQMNTLFSQRSVSRQHILRVSHQLTERLRTISQRNWSHVEMWESENRCSEVNQISVFAFQITFTPVNLGSPQNSSCMGNTTPNSLTRNLSISLLLEIFCGFSKLNKDVGSHVSCMQCAWSSFVIQFIHKFPSACVIHSTKCYILIYSSNYPYTAYVLL